MPERHQAMACKKFSPSGDGGSCSIHSSSRYPEVCKGFFCADARKKFARGNRNPCAGCTVEKMADEGCCVGTDVGFGTKPIQITREGGVDASAIERAADLILKGDLSVDDALDWLKGFNDK